MLIDVAIADFERETAMYRASYQEHNYDADSIEGEAMLAVIARNELAVKSIKQMQKVYEAIQGDYTGIRTIKLSELKEIVDGV